MQVWFYSANICHDLTNKFSFFFFFFFCQNLTNKFVLRFVLNPLQIVEILEGDEGSLEYATKRQKSKLQRTYSEELLDADDYNSTKCLSDREKQLEFILGTSNEA